MAIALSVAGISGVRGAADVAREALKIDSRDWIASDLCADTREPVSQDQIEALDRLKGDGFDWSLMTLAVTMGASDQSPDPALISVKAIDAARYPYYGKLVLDPPVALGPETAAVSEDVLERLQVRVGDAISLAGKRFVVAARIQAEPDRFSGEVGLGMRCLITNQGIDRTALEVSGNSVKHRILVRLGRDADLASARRQIQKIFPEGNVRDYRAAHRQQTALTEAEISFLSVAGLLVLMLGAIGVAMAVHQNAEAQLTNLAILRMLGARTSQIATVLLLQIAGLTVVALAIGIGLGFAVRVSVLSIAARFMVLPPAANWNGSVVLMSAFAALVGLAPVLLGPAMMVRNLRPALVLRRGSEPYSPRRSARIAIGLACLGLFALSLESSMALRLMAGLAGAAGAAWILTSVALTLLNRVRWRSAALRLGVAGLCRRGNHCRTLIVALAVALSIMIATFETGEVVAQGTLDLVPFDPSDLYIGNFKDTQGVRAFLERQTGVQKIQILTQARLDLKVIRNRAKANTAAGAIRDELLQAAGGGNEFNSDQWNYFYSQVTGIPQIAPLFPPGNRGLPMTVDRYLEQRTNAGLDDRSYPVRCYPPDSGRTALTIDEDLAGQLGVTPGSQLEFQSREKSISTTVGAIRKLTPVERFWFAMELDCRGLDPEAVYHQAAVRVRPGDIPSVRKALRAEYPALAIVTPEELSVSAKAASQDAIALVRLVAWYAIAAGVSVLWAVVAASRTARLNEIGILSALGARRSAIFRIYTIEFAAIGSVSSLIACVLACGFASLILRIVLHRGELILRWDVIAAAFAGSLLLTIGGGWLPSYGLLRRKPMDVLRSTVA